MLSESAGKKLLSLAREAVEAAVKGCPAPAGAVEDAELQGRQGAFVTLKTDGRLRGCLGCFVSDQPLWRTVREMAAASATRDPRFVSDRISPAGLADLEIAISVLSPLEKTTEPLRDLEPGTHGVYIRGRGRTGCFLPQVADEAGWDAESFLDNCCTHKAGLPAGAWRDDPDTEVFLFTAEVIRSKDVN